MSLRPAGASRSLRVMSEAPRTAPTDPSHEAFREAVLAKIRRDLEAEARTSARLRTERLSLLRGLVLSARADGVCGEVVLFGSYAWGQPTERSDVDLLIEGDTRELAWRVGRTLGCEVDAWRIQDAPETLVERARAEGIAL